MEMWKWGDFSAGFGNALAAWAARPAFEGRREFHIGD